MRIQILGENVKMAQEIKKQATEIEKQTAEIARLMYEVTKLREELIWRDSAENYNSSFYLKRIPLRLFWKYAFIECLSLIAISIYLFIMIFSLLKYFCTLLLLFSY